MADRVIVSTVDFAGVNSRLRAFEDANGMSTAEFMQKYLTGMIPRSKAATLWSALARMSDNLRPTAHRGSRPDMSRLLVDA